MRGQVIRLVSPKGYPLKTRDRVILAADDLTYLSAIDMTKRIGNRLHAVKIHSLYDQCSGGIIRELKSSGAQRVFADLKLHDIPKTVELRAKTIKLDGADIITVHASGGIEMMRAAMQSGATIFAITLLTSLSSEDTLKIYNRLPRDQVLYLAHMAKEAGVHGVVCSPLEAALIKARPELEGLLIVTPGIRSVGVAVNDQKRVDTPTAALKAGSDFLVIGRQITEAADPSVALDQLELELSHMEA